MEVKQIYSIVNAVSSEVLGKTDIVKDDLTGIVDLGTEVFNQGAVDNYVKSLVNHIGKVVFVNRPYSGKVPSVLMDAWEFGSVMEKISADVPAAVFGYVLSPAGHSALSHQLADDRRARILPRARTELRPC